MQMIPAAMLAGVSRETAERLEIYARELTRWQRALNLVSSTSIADLWRRHIDDSLQLTELEHEASIWLDLGSGGGLPGLIVAAVRPERHVTLIESDGRKCAFLRSTARRMGLTVDVHQARIESFVWDGLEPPQVVSARALASLPQLLAYAQPFLRAGAVALFPKGRNVARELTDAHKSWIFSVDTVPSRTDPEARILRIRDFAGPRT